jgi:hypothetical protein
MFIKEIKMEKKIKEEVKIVSKAEPKIVLDDADKIPSDWAFSPLEDGLYLCTNTVTRREFKGTIADFNKALK